MLIIGFLYFLGVALIIYPMIGNVYSIAHSRSEINDYNESVRQMDDTEIKEKLALAAKYNASIAKGSLDKEASMVINGRNGIMCYLEIPTLSIYLPVYYGTSDEVLKKGCGWLENTSLPVGGESTHSVISGHTGLPNAEMLTKLDNIKLKDVFYIYVYGQVLAYKVVSIDAVTPEHTEMLAVVPGKDYVTLLTCTPYGINDKRLLVKGERIDIDSPQEEEIAQDVKFTPPDMADKELGEQIRHEITIIIVIAAVSVIVFIAACIWLNIAVRKSKRPGKYYEREKQLEDGNAGEKEEKEEE